MNILVRLVCQRYVNDLVTTTATYNHHYHAPDMIISYVMYNGSTLTYVATTDYTTLTSGQWCYYGDTLYFKTIHGLNVDYKAVIWFYYFASTGGMNYYDLSPNGSAPRFYPPIIIEPPKFAKNLENINEGFITSNETSCSMVFNDDLFDILPQDSFYESELKYFTSDGTTTTLIFTSEITSWSRDLFKINFTISDSLRGLGIVNTQRSYAYYGDLAYTTVLPDEGDVGNKPIPLLIGSQARFGLRQVLVSGLYPAWELEPESMLEAQNISYNVNLVTGGNRKWCALGVAGDDISNPNSTAYTIYDVVDNTSHVRLTVINANLYFKDGDSAYYVHIVTAVITSLRIYGVSGNYIYVSRDAALPTILHVIFRYNFSLCITDENGISYYPRPRRDYDAYLASTIGQYPDLSGRTQLWFIEFWGALEANLGMDPLDCSKHKVEFTYRSTNAKHMKISIGNACAFLLGSDIEATGMDSSFSTIGQTLGGTDLPLCNIVVGDNEYKTTREYIQEVIKGTLSYLYLDSLGEIKFGNFASPTKTSVYNFDATNIIKGSFNYSENYDDIYSSMACYNSELPKTANTDYFSDDLQTVVLYFGNKLLELEHILTGVASPTRIFLNYFNYVKYPKRKVTFSCFANISVEIGDKITVFGKEHFIISLEYGKLSNNITAQEMPF